MNQIVVNELNTKTESSKQLPTRLPYIKDCEGQSLKNSFFVQHGNNHETLRKADEKESFCGSFVKE